MNKKIFMFGIPLLCIALVSAALVTYYSNPITETVNVESPLELIGGEFDVEAAEAFNIITTDFTLTNKAGVPVSTIVETSITGMKSGSQVNFDNGKVGTEFEVLKIGIKMPIAYKAACTGDAGSVDDEGEDNFYCYWDASYDRSFTGVEEGVYYVQMGSGDTPIAADGIMEGRMKLQFKTDITPARYTFVTQALTINEAKEL